MGNSLLSGQGVNEAHDSRDMDGTEFKDKRPNEVTKISHFVPPRYEVINEVTDCGGIEFDVSSILVSLASLVT